MRFGPGGKSDTRVPPRPPGRDRPRKLTSRSKYVAARFLENGKERVTKRRAMVDRLHTFIPPDSRMRLRLVGETFGRSRRERDGVSRVLEILDRSEVGQKLVGRASPIASSSRSARSRRCSSPTSARTRSSSCCRRSSSRS